MIPEGTTLFPETMNGCQMFYKGLKNMKAKVTLKTALIGIVIVAFFIGGGVLFVAEYMTESVVEAKVLAINTDKIRRTDYGKSIAMSLVRF